MSILGIIPARYASTRFPGKPLIDIMGRAMILRVYDQAIQSGVFEEVIVATDDQRIFDHVKHEGFQVVMTSDRHRSGTERCCEALDSREAHAGKSFSHVINIQGDEPFIHPVQIEKVAHLLVNENAEIATLAKRIIHQDEIFNNNVVKVVFNLSREALYFSRAPIPFLREISETQWTNQQAHYKHIGIYGFRTDILRQVCKLAPSALESHESLEQLRWLENGLKIKLDLTGEESISIDTPEDLLKITNIT
jgi:3-deoxy-manno-octulosonate cytidylyltransferase (CMP-KDO synthetase)